MLPTRVVLRLQELEAEEEASKAKAQEGFRVGSVKQESSIKLEVRDLTSVLKSITTTTAINDDNDDDDDNETKHDEPLHHHPSQTLHPAREGSSRRWFTELPKQKSELVEHSSLKARVGGRLYLHSPVPGTAQIITTSPSAQTLDFHPPDCSSRIIEAQVPVALPTCPTQWPIYKSTCVTTPAPAGSSREAESNIDPSIQSPGREVESLRFV